MFFAFALPVAGSVRAMSTLFTVGHIGPAKRYMWEKFVEMAEACIEPLSDTYIHLVTDQIDHGREALDRGWTVQGVDMGAISRYWSEDVCMYARGKGCELAILDGYDRIVWQGIDCLYLGAGQVKRLLEHGPVVGGLTAARNDADYPVCRRFVKGGEQVEMMKELDLELSFWWGDRLLLKAGFPGADCLSIDTEILRTYPFPPDHHVKWYEDGNFKGMCAEERWCYDLYLEFVPVFVDPAVTPWHVHETGKAARYKGVVSRLEDLSWSASAM